MEGAETTVAEETAAPAEAIAAPDEAPSPEAGEAVQVDAQAEGDVGAEPDAGEDDPFAALTSDEVDAILSRRPDLLEASAVVKEQQRRAEQRARTQLQEERQNRQQQDEGMGQLIAEGQQAAAWLESAMRAIDADLHDLDRWTDEETYDPQRSKQVREQLRQKLNPDYVLGALGAARAGALAEAASIFKQMDLAHVTKHADLIKEFPFTPEEDVAFQKARYGDARTGKRDAFDLLVSTLIERAEKRGEAKGFQKGIKDKAAQAAVAEQIAKIKSIKNGAAPHLPAQQAAPDNSTVADRLDRIGTPHETAADRAWWEERKRQRGNR